MKLRIILLITALFLSPLWAAGAEECLECHDKYRGTGHGKQDCIACHTDAGQLPHAEKLLKPVCAPCHGKPAKDYRTSTHASKGTSCKDCHNVHSPAMGTKKCITCHPSAAHETLPSARKHLAKIECTGCHAISVEGSIIVRLAPGKQIASRDLIDRDKNGFVDQEEWNAFLSRARSEAGKTPKIDKDYIIRGDTHNVGRKAVSCSSCHTGHQIFRKATLEVRGASKFSLPLEPQSVIPRLPLPELYKLTPHGKGGVRCRDCHTSQARISDAVCSKCHGEVSYVYKNTIHGKKTATKCTDCHNPHEIKAYRELSAGQRISVCVRCHKDYEKKHRWLPHTQLHFMYLECSTCHSPRSTKSMVFTINVRTEKDERALDHDDIASVFARKGTSRDLIDKDGDGRIASSELVAFLTAFQNKKSRDILVKGSIVVTGVFHDYSQVQKKEKVCTNCHSDDAPFYNSMYLALPEADGTSYLPVKGTVLSAFPSSLAVNMFLLGETKINWNDIGRLLRADSKTRGEFISDLGFKWIDFFGIFFSLLAMLFVCVHIIIRLVFKR